MGSGDQRKSIRRTLLAVAALLAVTVPLGWQWQQSLIPESYNALQMGEAEHGGHAGHTRPGGRTSVQELVADPAREADVHVELHAARGTVNLPNGEEIEGYTLNGSTPGPTIRAKEGELVEVVLHNDDVEGGVTLHWHGVDVPNAVDGVAGVTQDAVPPGSSHTYRFVAERGTYWYHSHQLSHEQVRDGLLGGLVVEPGDGTGTRDVLALSHVYDGHSTINGTTGTTRIPAAPGETLRVRLVNTDNGSMRVWTTRPYRVVAVDGQDVNEPGEVRDQHLSIPAGGRADLEVTIPATGAVTIELGGPAALVLGDGDRETREMPGEELDLLGYGTPAPVGFDPGEADRTFEYSIGRRPGFLDGRPGLWWSINGALGPDVPMYMVSQGDVVVMEIENHSGQMHPMHLHGHHVVVLERNGERASGSPWWSDSLEVENGESYKVAFVADNPGIWMDHCHNLPHAAEGLTAHLAYEGVTTPYRIGGERQNVPE